VFVQNQKKKNLLAVLDVSVRRNVVKPRCLARALLYNAKRAAICALRTAEASACNTPEYRVLRNGSGQAHSIVKISVHKEANTSIRLLIYTNTPI
jgi:hypothetical protein